MSDVKTIIDPIDGQEIVVRYEPPNVTVLDTPTHKDELRLGDTLAHRHGHELRWVHRQRTWYAWDGDRWIADDEARVLRLAKSLVMGSEAHQEMRVVRAVVASAACDLRLQAEISHFDSDPMVLCTPGGTVDLRTGELRENAREDMCTRMTAVAPAEPGTDAPRWRRFMSEITEGDREVEAYLQRIAGLCLTGDVSDQKIYCFYGMGANGKGTFANLLYWLLGDYATVMSSTTLVAQKFEAHSTEIAKLNGCRLALASEVDPGQRWALAKLKRLTGEDPLTGRFMRKDDIEFFMQGKLIALMNHQPDIDDVDDAIRRRFAVVPFTASFAAKEDGGTRDNGLRAALQAEGPAILRWAVEGCLQWRRIGLAPPKRVTDASQQYMADEDGFGDFIDATFILDADAFTSAAEAFGRWVKHCEAEHEDAGKQTGFAKRLKKKLGKRIRPDRDERAARGYRGLRVRPGLPPIER